MNVKPENVPHENIYLNLFHLEGLQKKSRNAVNICLLKAIHLAFFFYSKCICVMINVVPVNLFTKNINILFLSC